MDQRKTKPSGAKESENSSQAENVRLRRHRPSLLRSFIQYYGPHKGLFWGDTACAIVQAACDLAFPVILRALTDGLFRQGTSEIFKWLWAIALGLIVMYAVRYGCKYFISCWGHIMGARMESAMRRDLFDQYERFSFSYFDRHNTGDLMSRLVSDLFDISEAAHHLPEAIIVCLIQVIGSFIIMFFIGWQLALAMAAITVVLAVYNVYVNKRMKAIFTENRERISTVNTQLEDSLGGARVVKSFANENLERKKFGRANDAYLSSKEDMYHALGNYQAAAALLTGALYTTIIVLGGYLVAIGQMTVVDLATFALYVSLFTTPLQTLIDFTEMFQKALAGFRRFDEVLATKPDIEDAPGAKPLEVKDGRVEYKNVWFHYPTTKELAQANDMKPATLRADENERTLEDRQNTASNPNTASANNGAALPQGDRRPVLQDLNITIEAGKTYALVGPSGGGKSTTCALLPRFYDVDQGAITIDGQDVRHVTVDSLHRAIGIVQQDVYLFNGTIGENIAYGRPDASQEEIEQAARNANIHEFIQSLPDGYNTEVGERGGHLSGGQKQRIAIARVFLKNPAILVLDEATSALDNESEAAVQESLAHLAKDRTTLVIAHRLSTIKDADVIITIADGKVAEIGTHNELLKKNGIYANYFRMQFGDHV